MGVVMSLTSTATLGKILAAWLPVFIFFAQGFEHAVVNMFVIPAGMLLGAKVTWQDWWMSNQLPATLGNIIGGFIFTALALYVTHGRKNRDTGCLKRFFISRRPIYRRDLDIVQAHVHG